jgi:sugar (pentulose or hexulose) kinase
LEAQGFNFTQALLVGGPSKSPVWPSIIAEITGLELSVGSAHAGAQGAALLAGIGAKNSEHKD